MKKKLGVLFIVFLFITGCAYGVQKKTSEINSPQVKSTETTDIKGFFMTGDASSYRGYPSYYGLGNYIPQCRQVMVGRDQYGPVWGTSCR
jgi:hypothetical protein